MAQIKIYKSLSDAGELREVSAGVTVSAALSDVANWADFVIIANGSTVTAQHEIKENDLIVIRRIPGATIGTFALITGFAMLGAGAIQLGLDIAESRKEAAKLSAEVANLKNSTSNNTVNLSFIRGSSNTGATGKTQPYIIGRHLFTPYILNGGKNFRGFSTISGTDGKNQNYNVVLEAGFNKQHIEKIYVDDITIKEFTGADAQEGIYNIEAGIFSGENSFIEIAQDGADFATDIFNKKIIEKIVNEKLDRKEASNPNAYKDKYYTLEENAQGVNVCIMFNGLRGYTSDGTAGAAERTINAEYSADYAYLSSLNRANEATWTAFKFDQNGTKNNTFRRNTLDGMRFIAHADFNYSDIFNGSTKKYNAPVTVRISSPDQKPTEGSDNADVYIQFIQSICYDTNKTKKAGAFVEQKIIEAREAARSTIIGVSIQSTEENEEKLKTIQIITNGMARTWNGTSWSNDRTPTSNPAAWLLEILTSSAHTPSQISDNEIDLASFGAWYKFCNDNNHSINYVISQGMTKSAIFDMLCETGRAQMYRNIYGKIAVAIDCAKENAIAVLNEQNLISFNYEKSIGRKVDGVKVTYIDAAAEFQENEIIVMYDGSDPDERSADSILTSVKLNGITNYEEAYKHCLYLMKQNELRPRSCHATVGEEGFYFVPYDKVLIQHPAINTGMGNGQIRALILDDTQTNITGFELYDGIKLEANKNYNMVVSCVYDGYSTPLSVTIKGYNGFTNEVELNTPISRAAAVVPHAGDVFSYGNTNENITDAMLITGIERTENGYSLTLVDYDESIITDITNIPAYVPDFVKPYKPINSTISNNVTRDDLEQTKAAAVDYTDKEIAIAGLKGSPTYQVIYNAPVIRKGTDGAYTPATITGTAYKTTDTQTLYEGVWSIKVNGEDYTSITASNIELNINTLIEQFGDLSTLQIEFKSKGENPLKYSDVLIPVLTGASAYNVRLSNNGQVYEANEKGVITARSVTTTARVYYGLQELQYLAADGWEYGIITPPAGFTVSVNASNGVITITALEGSAMAASGEIEIPIFIHSQTNTENFAGYETESGVKMWEGYGENFAGYLTPDENGYFYDYFRFQKLTETAVKLAELNRTVEKYWQELTDDLIITTAEKETLRILLNGITGEYTKYTANYSKHTKYAAYKTAYDNLYSAINTVLNYSGNYPFENEASKNAFNAKFENYNAAKAELDGEISAVSTYFGPLDDVADIPATKKPTDYFIWTGTDKTAITGVILRRGLVYAWNGSAWVESTDAAHTMATMPDVMEFIKNSNDDTIPAVSFAKNFTALKIVTDQLSANFATINELKAGTLTVKGTIEADAGYFGGLMGKSQIMTWGDLQTNFNNEIYENKFETVTYSIYLEKENNPGTTPLKRYDPIAEFTITAGYEYIPYYQTNWGMIHHLSVAYTDELYITDIFITGEGRKHLIINTTSRMTNNTVVKISKMRIA